MNDKYEITPPSAHGAPDGFYVSRPRPLSTRFYVNSALLLAVGAVCILVGFLGKRVHEKSLNCEEEKKAAVSCDSETTTQKVIDGVAQCVPVLSCETGEVSEAGVCESKEKSQKVQAWKWVLLCAVILGMLYVVFRKGRGRARIGGQSGHVPLSLTPYIVTLRPGQAREPLAGTNPATLQRAKQAKKRKRETFDQSTSSQRRWTPSTAAVSGNLDVSSVATKVDSVKSNRALEDAWLEAEALDSNRALEDAWLEAEALEV